MTNYNITWKRDTAADYKFYHKTNSIITPSEKKKENPWRYPFVDVFIYKHHQQYNVTTYRNRFKDLTIDGVELRKTGFDSSYKWPNGTRLTKFGYFEMRVSLENRKYLQKLMSSTWHDVGRIPWYDHYNNYQRNPTAFQIPHRLYVPALPFSI